ncbi:MAG: tRNA 2-thiocytidine(32) synthetase TtcA, partial [Bacteroidales bacterium]|nr:tRNA 2-thiocytidine(32) synthetase TtcA [Bacteroidales bacterium]
MRHKLTKQEQAFIQKVRQTAGKAINQYQMIAADDTVMVAVSGGKDSLALLEILSSRRKGMPVHYTIHAAHIITEDVPYQIDTEWLQA